jgi:hypothetical protein
MKETSMTSGTQEMHGACAPWWKHGHVWLVIAGPALVVVAGVVTAWIAVRDPDPVLAEDYYRRGLQLGKPAAGDKAHMPALQGRNHAATPPGR